MSRLETGLLFFSMIEVSRMLGLEIRVDGRQRLDEADDEAV